MEIRIKPWMFNFFTLLLLHVYCVILSVCMQQDKINKYLAKSGGLISAAWCRENNIPTVYLSRMVDKGLIQQVAKGLYVSADAKNYDEFYFFQYQYKKPVFSFESALYLFGMTDKIINIFDVTVPQHYKFNQIPQNISVHYVNESIFNLGVVEIKTHFGNTVRTYSLERTVCDFIKNKDQSDTETYVKFLHNYSSQKKKDLNKLWQYAQAMNITDKVRSVMEILL